ncbi:MAG: NAD-dependent epimerase/dehydratase family protein [Gemmatimonadetes bacterium]|nr:NAD-dependent epimerase/dehydratase family protein [Gemmatimonadota bacterium]
MTGTPRSDGRLEPEHGPTHRASGEHGGTTLVTGATGFIGSALVERLLRRGDRVRVLVRSSDRLSTGLMDRVEVVEGDVRDDRAVRRAVAGCELIYGIAGSFREPGLPDSNYFEVHVEATERLISAAAESGVKRVVHCSTCGIHGDVPKGEFLDEDAPFRPDGVYEISKAEGDELARELGARLGVEVAVIRPTPVYGPGDTRLLKLFKMCNRDRVLMLGSGTARYHLVYIDDLVDALLLAGEHEAAPGEAFLIGGGEIPTLGELLAELARVLGREDQRLLRLPAGPVRLLAHANEIVARPFGVAPLLYRRRVDFFTNNRAFDIRKAKRLLGYQPTVSLAVGLRRTAKWYRDRSLLPELDHVPTRESGLEARVPG